MGEIINPDDERIRKELVEHPKDRRIENRRSFLKRFAVGIGTALIASFFLANDQLGRNLSEAQAAELAKRITSKYVGVSPLTNCGNNYCGSGNGSACPDTYCGGEYCYTTFCTSKSPNSCWLLHGSCTSDYCGGYKYCREVFCSNYDDTDSCEQYYCASTNYYCPQGIQSTYVC